MLKKNIIAAALILCAGFWFAAPTEASEQRVNNANAESIADSGYIMFKASRHTTVVSPHNTPIVPPLIGSSARRPSPGRGERGYGHYCRPHQGNHHNYNKPHHHRRSPRR